MPDPLPADRGPLPFDREWILAPAPDPVTVERAVADLQTAAASPASPARIAQIVRSIDLTSLDAVDTPAVIRRLCARARAPLGPAGIGTPDAPGIDREGGAGPAPPASHPLPRHAGLQEVPAGVSRDVHVAAVCVQPYYLALARRELQQSDVRVAVVAGGFPTGLSTLRQRVSEVRECVEEGADEIDTVINRALALTGEWEEMYEELVALREAAAGATLKVILATGELPTFDMVARAARTALLAGADFIKTSTGREAVNATLPAGLVMLETLREHRALTGRRAGFKAAGGIRTPEQALAWILLTETSLDGPVTPDLFRIGASGLLDTLISPSERPAAPAAY